MIRYFLSIIIFIILWNTNFSNGLQHEHIRNGTNDAFNCCSLVYGSCRISCENLQLVQLATDSHINIYKLGDLRNYCPSIQMDFWHCMNQTLDAISRNSQWPNRKCCSLSISHRCQNACAVSSSKNDLSLYCRQSDEHRMFACFEKLDKADKCCSNSRTSECLQACRDIFEKSKISKETISYMSKLCAGDNYKVLKCIKDFTESTPLRNPEKLVPCCGISNSTECKKTCQNALEKMDSMEEIIDELESGGCGPPLPQDPLWQCFLADGKTIQFTSNAYESSQINQIGLDSAKIHCCPKSISQKCLKLCVQIYSNDWNSAREEFEKDCLLSVNEIELKQCIDDVDEPCTLGCDGLTFCTNFNNRPTELFRSCNEMADFAAKNNINNWQHLGFLEFLTINLQIKNISRCSPDTWHAVACALQIKPCVRQSHTNLICREDCYDILNKCLDWTRLDSSISAANICSKISPENDLPCLSLKPYLSPSEISVENYRITSSCKNNSCNSTQICLPFRNQTIGYQCVNGCFLGPASSYMVPVGAYVRIPISSNQYVCLKICKCGTNGKLENCQPLPCFSYEPCFLANRRIEHGTWFYVECNVCSCYAGELICTKKQCQIPGISDESFTGLACNCPAHYVPVCGKNGNTYPSACIAKCMGVKVTDFDFGSCSSKDPCFQNSCPDGTKCILDRKICLSVMHKPCSQHKCVNITSQSDDNEPVCDSNGLTFPSIRSLWNSRSTFSYFGSCYTTCNSHVGPVCGVSGVTYQHECEAWTDFSIIDYYGECREIGVIVPNIEYRCKHIVCPNKKKKIPYCKNIIPPGACCPICAAGSFRVVFSRKQIDRALYPLKGNNMNILTLRNILKALDNLIEITECQLIGYLTIESDLFIAITNYESFPNHIQIEACAREAEKLATLIAKQSHKITSSLILSSLTVAIPVNPELKLSSAFSIRKLNKTNSHCLLFSLILLWYISYT